jgi:hypothetical protein
LKAGRRKKSWRSPTTAPSREIVASGLSKLAPGQPVEVVIHKANSQEVEIVANHSKSDPRIGWFKGGSGLNALNLKSAKF